MRRHLSYANVVATFALLFAMSGGALAAKHYLINSTKQINPKVVKALRGKAGSTGKEGPPGKEGKEGKEGKQGPAGTVETSNFYTKTQSDGRYLQSTSRGVALAGANIKENGEVSRYFNTFGGAPSVTHESTGVYDIEFPGASFTAADTLLSVTADTASVVSTMVQADYCCTNTIVVQTYDGNGTSGTHANRQFHLLVFGASATG
jgi:hypothetical protein